MSQRKSNIIGASMAAAAVLVIAAGVVSAGFFLNAKWSNACKIKGDEYGLSSNFKFWAKTCFATLPNGQRINIDKIYYREGR